jgi:uncharacterized protein (DUF1800 family)
MASLNPLQGALGRRRAAHLLRRVSFRYTKEKVDELSKLTAAESLATLLKVSPLKLEQPAYAKGAGAPATWINPPKPSSTPLPAEDIELRRYVMAWWVNEALHDPGAGHKMEFFLTQYLAVAADSGSSAQFFDYLSLIRWGCLGNFKKLVTKIVTDNCMLNYLDNNQNYNKNPNENFAREFFELYTIGKGEPAGAGDYTNYTEDDIVEAARVFTGFNNALRTQSVDKETNIPAGKGYPQSHDFESKTFSARFGGTVISPASKDADGMTGELNALVDMVFAQPETARNICRRLYRFFVTRKISAEAETDIIEPLAQTFIGANFELKPVLEQLLQSQHFFDADDASGTDEIIGALIKSPLDLSLEALSFFNIPIPDPDTKNREHYQTFYGSAVLERMLTRAGMDLFYPPDVAGYPGYYQEPELNRMFFNSATIISRYKLPQMLLTGKHAYGGSEAIGTKLDIAAWLRDSKFVADPSDSYLIVKEFVSYLFPEEPSNERATYFLESIFLDKLPPADWTYEWENYIKTGDDSEVSIPLGRLVNALMYAPEYQVF